MEKRIRRGRKGPLGNGRGHPIRYTRRRSADKNMGVLWGNNDEYVFRLIKVEEGDIERQLAGHEKKKEELSKQKKQTLSRNKKKKKRNYSERRKWGTGEIGSSQRDSNDVPFMSGNVLKANIPK